MPPKTPKAEEPGKKDYIKKAHGRPRKGFGESERRKEKQRDRRRRAAANYGKSIVPVRRARRPRDEESLTKDLNLFKRRVNYRKRGVEAPRELGIRVGQSMNILVDGKPREYVFKGSRKSFSKTMPGFSADFKERGAEKTHRLFFEWTGPGTFRSHERRHTGHLFDAFAEMTGVEMSEADSWGDSDATNPRAEEGHAFYRTWTIRPDQRRRPRDEFMYEK